MIKRTVAILVPYTDSGKIFIQNRNSISKAGEKWGFWGGEIEEGETKEQAVRREIKEELNFDLAQIKYLGSVSAILRKSVTGTKDYDLKMEVFTTRIKEDKSLFKIMEGDGGEFFTLEQCKSLKMTPVIDVKVLDMMLDLLE